MRGRFVVTYANVTETVDDTLVVKNAIGNGQFFNQRGIGFGNRHDVSSFFV